MAACSSCRDVSSGSCQPLPTCAAGSARKPVRRSSQMCAGAGCGPRSGTQSRMTTQAGLQCCSRCACGAAASDVQSAKGCPDWLQARFLLVSVAACMHSTIVSTAAGWLHCRYACTRRSLFVECLSSLPYKHPPANMESSLLLAMIALHGRGAGSLPSVDAYQTRCHVDGML